MFLFLLIKVFKVLDPFNVGKYIIKIIVKQGNISKVYHFIQTIKMVSDDRKHHDEEF